MEIFVAPVVQALDSAIHWILQLETQQYFHCRFSPPTLFSVCETKATIGKKRHQWHLKWSTVSRKDGNNFSGPLIYSEFSLLKLPAFVL